MPETWGDTHVLWWMLYTAISEWEHIIRIMDCKKDTRSKDIPNTGRFNPFKTSKLRGYYKKKSTFFSKDRQPCSRKRHVYDTEDTTPVKRPCERHTDTYFDTLVKETDSNEFSIPGADGSEGSAILLRPRHTGTHGADDSTERGHSSGRYNVSADNIVVEKSRLLDLINGCSKRHMDLDTCKDMNWDLIEFEPWGLFSSVVLTCSSCGFRSPRTKLYEEVSTGGPGRKAAVGNVRLQLLLQDMPIGPTELQLIFAAVGLRAGSLSGMQKMSYKASDVTEEVADTDMIKWREHAKKVLADRGIDKCDQISAAFDVRYHGMFKASSKTPGPGAAQATATCVETVTPQKKCIAIDHINKACLKGSRMKGKGVQVFCGTGGDAKHKGCTANQPSGRAIREYDMAERIAKDILASSDMAVTNLCTDSDATGRDAFSRVNIKSGKSLPPLTWYKDPSHVSRNMKRHVLDHNFSSEAFGLKHDCSEWNYKERLDCRKALALDVPERVSFTLRSASKHYKGDFKKVKKNVGTLVNYMMKCYGGDHGSCQSAPLAQLTGCKGSANSSKCWFTKSSSLKGQGISNLKLIGGDYEFLKSVIEMKLSEEAIDFFSRRETTSRCESINRAISKSCPKNRLFSRTSRGRVCSAIGRQNNSFRDFVHMKFRAMNCSLPPHSIGYKIIQKYQRKRDLTLTNQKKTSATKRRQSLLAERRREYFTERLKYTNEGEYHKYQLDLALKAKEAALDSIDVSEPLSSTSLVNQIERAAGTSKHMRETIKQAKKYTVAQVRSKLRSQRRRSKPARKRIEDKNTARKMGSRKTRSIRMEHSYGAIYN